MVLLPLLLLFAHAEGLLVIIIIMPITITDNYTDSSKSSLPGSQARPLASLCPGSPLPSSQCGGSDV